ncbi:hypothetical protein KSP40_PGU012651 [Platanthera guangdongensis]|uniref:Uncharacterized protein n=1 Tax=Platanthera guangdongensis TaxID=2320717 RepID=A0ABR2M2X5_9ASPA
MTSPSPSRNTQTPALKTYFKTPEGRYKLHNEKTHPASLLQFSHGKTVSQLTIADLKEKSASQTPAGMTPASSASSMRTVASRFLGGAGSGAKALGFSSGNGASKGSFSGSKIAGSVPSSMGWSSYSSNSNYDGRGTFPLQDPVKSIQFGNSNPVCHAFGSETNDGHDLLIGMQSGEIYSVSLRQQLHDVGKRLAGGQHYNKDGVITSRFLQCDDCRAIQKRCLRLSGVSSKAVESGGGGGGSGCQEWKLEGFRCGGISVTENDAG